MIFRMVAISDCMEPQAHSSCRPDCPSGHLPSRQCFRRRRDHSRPIFHPPEVR